MAKAPKAQGPIVVHLVKGNHEVKWYESEAALKSALKIWPPQSQGGCELRWDEGRHIPHCENVSCKGRCLPNLVPGSDGNIYWFCTCS